MSVQTPDFAQTLRSAGLRATQQRVVIMSLLMEADDHPTAEDLLGRARALDDSVSIATVYRTLAALEEAGLARKLTLENESARYESTPALEHDHIIDIDTGEVIEIFSEDINRLRRELIARHGFEIVSQHSLIRARRIGQD